MHYALGVAVGDLVVIEEGEEAEDLGVVGDVGVLIEIDLKDGNEDLPYLVRISDDNEWWVESVSVFNDDVNGDCE